MHRALETEVLDRSRTSHRGLRPPHRSLARLPPLGGLEARTAFGCQASRSRQCGRRRSGYVVHRLDKVDGVAGVTVARHVVPIAVLRRQTRHFGVRRQELPAPWTRACREWRGNRGRRGPSGGWCGVDAHGAIGHHDRLGDEDLPDLERAARLRLLRESGRRQQEDPERDSGVCEGSSVREWRYG